MSSLFPFATGPILNRWQLIIHSLVCLVLTAGAIPDASAGPISVQKKVDSHAAPWNPAIAGNFVYGSPFNGSAPTIFSAADGFEFTAGQSIEILWVGDAVPATDLTKSSPSSGSFDGYGDTTTVANSTAYPAHYVPGIGVFGGPTGYENELMGIFADSSGHVIGTPFLIDDGPKSIGIPVGATQLQLGLNAKDYSDNSGFLLVQVHGPGDPVPEPGSLALFGCGLLGLLGYRRWNRRKIAAR